jgi:hypothetical protein
VYTFHTSTAANLLGTGTVGVSYSENHKPSPYACHLPTKL